MERRSLETSSVKALVEASDLHYAEPLKELPVDLFHSHLSQSFKLLPLTRHRARRRYYVQPCLRTNYSQVVRKSRLLAKNLTIGSDQTPGDRRKPVQTSEPIKPMLNANLLAVKCKCLFLGGGGFKIANSDTPCESRICINRSRTKYDWMPYDSDASPLSPKRIRHCPGLLPIRNKRHIPKLTRTRASDDLSDMEVLGPHPTRHFGREDSIDMAIKVKGRGRRGLHQY